MFGLGEGDEVCKFAPSKAVGLAGSIKNITTNSTPNYSNFSMECL